MESNNMYVIFESEDLTDPVLSMIRGKLQDLKIDYFEEGNEPRIKLSGAAYFDIKIKVDKKDFESANEIVRQIKSNRNTNEMPSFCPKCDNNKIVERQVFSILPWMPKKKFRCTDCGYEWKKDDL